ncbi:MAG: hypothetical protein ABL891_14770 [Burkholderiales bacterium]
MTEFTTDWAAQLVTAFDASGVHRVGTPGDLASGAWFESEAAKSGVAVSRMSVPIQHTSVEDAYLECAGLRIDGLPMFDSPSTSGVSGNLCISSSDGARGGSGSIGLAEFPSNAASIKGQPLERLRRGTQHAALVVATRVTGDSLAPINAQYYHTPFGPPVLQVAGMHHAFLAEHAGKPVKLVSSYRRVAAASFNVVAVADNTTGGNSAQPIAVVTPRTGWWESTAERAGGMVAWLAAVHAAGALKRSGKLSRDVHAYATCGHELGHLGLQTLTQQQAPLVKNAKYWLHLGANLGGAGNLTMMIRAADATDSEAMRDLLIAEGYPAQYIHIEPISKISGEGHDLNHLGGKVISLAGSNLHFHAASDRWPGNVNAAGIASISRAVARWVNLQAGQ